MAITDDQVALLRTQLRGEFDEYERLYAEFDKSHTDGYIELMGAAFILATERRFRPNGTRPDLIMYVANVRSKTRKAAESIDPKIAERLLLAALTDEPIDDLDANEVILTQLHLLVSMTAAEDFPASEVDGLLAKAREIVDSADS